jgi:ribosome biogenesis ATPase
LRIEPLRGVLFVGPPGTGKTYLANAIGAELDLPFHRIAAPEVVSGMSGESEQKLRELFRQATETTPSVIFIDEIDAITPKRSNASKEMEKRIVAQLISCIDDLPPFLDAEGNGSVLLLAATSHIDAIDPALRRAGRFDREIHFGIPNET